MKKLIFLIIILIEIFILNAIPVFGNVKLNTEISNLNELKNLCLKNQSKHIIVCGNNDIAVEISVIMLDYLEMYQDSLAWSLKSDYLPPVCNIKQIKYIAVDGLFNNYKLSLIKHTEQVAYYSAYDYLKLCANNIGESKKNNYTANKYKMQMSNLKLTNDSLLLITNTGKEIWGSDANELVFNNNYFSVEGDTILALWENPPNISLSNIYDIMKESVQKTPTLAIFIDALGYHLLENYAIKRNIKFEDLGFIPTRSVYPSKTQYAYFTLGSGKYFDKHNPTKIFDDTVFKKGVIIEEEKCYHDSPVPILLNFDQNNNGLQDDEIFLKAQKEIKKNYSFILVHFHSVDDIAHKYGPYHDKTLVQIDIVFDYIEKLRKNFKGNIILFSDHGQHAVFNAGGNHGSTHSDDIIGVYKYVKK